MGNLFAKEAPPPVVLVPPLFERPELATRSRMTESSYDILFSKLARARLFREYFEEADQLLGRIMLQPPHDSRVDVTATVRAPRQGVAGDDFSGEAVFRFQRDWVDPNTFFDVTVSNSNNVLKLRACSYDTATGLGVFASAPLISNNRVEVDDFGIIGLRYSTNKVSVGAVASPLEYSVSRAKAWAVGKAGPITAGFQYKPTVLGDPQLRNWDDRKNWSFAIDYGTAGKGPLNPSFGFCIEVCGDYKLIASYYHHLVVQRRVKNPFEEVDVVGITNYIDVGFEFEQRLRESASYFNASPTQQQSMQLAGSWQANKNFLLKAKLGSINSSLVLCFKSWWQPSFTFSFAVAKDHFSGKARYGFGVRTENFGGVSYERADPNYVMLTPSKTYTAEGIMRIWARGPCYRKMSLPVVQKDYHPSFDLLKMFFRTFHCTQISKFFPTITSSS